MGMRYYVTEGGVYVTGPQRPVGDKGKIPCWKAKTRGFHGWLWFKKLTPVLKEKIPREELP